MKLRLKDLKPFALRDFKVDPVDNEQVKVLKKSITQDGFWNGPVIRRNTKGDHEVIAGWHRVLAAIEAGVKYAELFVTPNNDDESALRIYARENASQRAGKEDCRAMAGSVAGAITHIARMLLSDRKVSKIFETLEAFDSAKGYFQTKGIGEPLVCKLLHEVPGIETGTVREIIKSLKQSNDYDRLVKAVYKEFGIQPPHKEVKDPTFDFAGVNKHLRNRGCLKTFRETVTDPKVAKYLPVDKQAAVAKALVEHANEVGEETISPRFVREHIHNEVKAVRGKANRLSEEEARELRRTELVDKIKYQEHLIANSGRGLFREFERLEDIWKDWDQSELGPLRLGNELKTALGFAQKFVERAIKLFDAVPASSGRPTLKLITNERKVQNA